MHTFEISISKIAFTHKIDHPNVIIGECEKFITEEDSIGVVMKVEVINCEIIESTEALVVEDSGWEGIQLGEEMLGMGTVVGLKELSEEECSLGFDGGEDCWLLLVG
jgi:hypothetical protein